MAKYLILWYSFSVDRVDIRSPVQTLVLMECKGYGGWGERECSCVPGALSLTHTASSPILNAIAKGSSLLRGSVGHCPQRLRMLGPQGCLLTLPSSCELYVAWTSILFCYCNRKIKTMKYKKGVFKRGEANREVGSLAGWWSKFHSSGKISCLASQPAKLVIATKRRHHLRE